MSETTDVRRVPVQRELVRDLRNFLSLEAPFLLPELPPEASLVELEELLVTRVERLFRLASPWGGVSIYPGLDRARAADRECERVTRSLRGFFERQRIKAEITADERLLMYRTMLLTRGIDDALKRGFDEKTVVWENHPSPQKGFRSTGQEAIVGAGLRLRRPPHYAARRRLLW